MANIWDSYVDCDRDCVDSAVPPEPTIIDVDDGYSYPTDDLLDDWGVWTRCEDPSCPYCN